MTTRKRPSLYLFQETGVQWLAKRHCAYLADKPGLGKTVQAVVAATRLGVRHPTIICPAIAIEVWRSHWHEWGDRSIDPTIFSYEHIVKTPRLQQEIPKLSDLVIFDEWHYAKNPTTKRAIAAGYIASRAVRVWLLSATPIPNNPSEIYTTLRAVWPRLLKKLGVHSYQEFVEKFCVSELVRYPNGVRTRIVGSKNPEQLREVLSLIMLRRSIEDVELELLPARARIPATHFTFWSVQVLRPSSLRHHPNWWTIEAIATVLVACRMGLSISSRLEVFRESSCGGLSNAQQCRTSVGTMPLSSDLMTRHCPPPMVCSQSSSNLREPGTIHNTAGQASSGTRLTQ